MTHALARWRTGRAWATNLVLCALGLGLLLLARQFVSETHRFTIGFSGVSGWSVVLYLAAVIIILTQPVNRATLWIVLAFAIAQRAVTLVQPPYLSTDIYRYVWDGIVQHAHINPYRYPPGNPALTALRPAHADVFANINRRDYARTIYPPVAQLFFFLVTFFGQTVRTMKLALFLCECITAAALIALLRQLARPAAEVLLYAWCPLLIWEIAGAGHVDALVYMFVTLALLFRARNQPTLTGLFLGCAILSKFYPLILLPALWQPQDGCPILDGQSHPPAGWGFAGYIRSPRFWRMPAAIAAVILTGYTLYASAGKLVFGFLGGYTEEEGMNTGTRYFLYELAHHKFPSLPLTAYLAFCALVFALITLWCWRNANQPPKNWPTGPLARWSTEMFPASHDVQHTPAFLRGSLALALALMLLFSPHYPWYVAWLIPLYTLAPSLTAIVYVCAMFYGLTTQWAEPGPKMFFLNHWIYAAVFAAAFISAIMRKHWHHLSAREPHDA